MNKFERLIYDKVKSNLWLKNKIVSIYQRLFSVIPYKAIESNYEIKIREGYFFGFHDKCPWSGDNKMLLAHRYNIPHRMPYPEEPTEIGFFTGENYEEFSCIGKTRAWNWQTGSMLQWVGNGNSIIFNDYEDGSHVAKVMSPSGILMHVIPIPIAAVSPKGDKAISHSFTRLRKHASAYSYANGNNTDDNNLCSKSSSLSIVCLNTLSISNLFSVSDIASIEQLSSMKGAYHYFTHCLFSPSGKRFVFYHRWTKDNKRTYTRMISCNIEGKDLYIFPTNGMVSHITWLDEEKIIAYANTDQFGDKYYIFKDKTNEYSVIGENSFKSDGHPQYSADIRRIVTDTYPNRSRIQSLFLYNVEMNKLNCIAKLYSPIQYKGDLRCDLHPRFNRDGSMICFDSAHTGIRALCTIELGDYKRSGTIAGDNP